MSLIEELYKKQKREIEEVKSDVTKLSKSSEVSSFAYGFVSSTLAEAIASNPSTFQVRFITNGRKSGETAGNGTGVPAYYDSNSSSWLNFYDNGTVIV